MAEPVSELIVAIRADISQLKANLDKARGETRKWGRIQIQETRNLQQELKRFKEPISNITQLANGMGAAFGGAASKATGLINGVVSGFVAGGPVGIAIGAAIGAVSLLADRYGDAKEAAEKAAKDAAEAHRKEQAAIREKIGAVDEYIRAQRRSREIAVKGELRVTGGESIAVLDTQIRAAQNKQRDAARALAGDPTSKDLKAASDAATKDLVALQQERVAKVEAINREHNEQTKADYREAQEFQAGEDAKRGEQQAADLKERQRALEEFHRRAGDYVLEQLERERAARQERQDMLAEFERRAAEYQIEQIRLANEKQLEEIRRAQEETDRLGGFVQNIGGSVADLLIAPLTEGFASIADFAKAAQRMLLSLIASLVKAAIVAAILTALVPGFGAVAGGANLGFAGIFGKVLGFAEGGPVPGRDTVPAMLEPGEYVMPVSAVRAYGTEFMDAIRAGGRRGFAAGGLVHGAGGKTGGDTYIVQSFDTPAIARNAGRLDTVNTRRTNNRQGALYRETLRRNLRG